MYKRCYGKINLGLDVCFRRDDGYHELAMIMLPITFYDELIIDKALYPRFSSNKSYVQSNPDNTITKAIAYLREKYQFKENFDIRLNKHIPTRAGLAGGSSDGAMCILAVNELLDLRMSDEELKEAAMAVGSDVYFCLLGKPAVVRGTGDIVEPFDFKLDPWILLVKPKVGVSTKKSFETLDLKRCDHPDIAAIRNDIINDDYQGMITKIANSLEEPSFRLVPQIKTIKDELLTLGLDAALMSGSGSTVFGLSNDEKIIDQSQKIMAKKGYFVRKVKVVR